MTITQNILEFDELDGDLAASGVQSTASEIHGFICGWLSCGQEVKPGDWQEALAIYLGIEQLTTQLERTVDKLIKANYLMLSKMDSDFRPMLPDDESPMAFRVTCLGQWCSGFLSAFVEGYRGDMSALSEEAQEAIGDLQAIASVEDEEENEQNEKDYFNIVEFVKVACQILAAECGKFVVLSQDAKSVH